MVNESVMIKTENLNCFYGSQKVLSKTEYRGHPQ